MKIFTNGKLTILRTATHLYRWPRQGEASVDVLRKSSATECFHDGLLLVAPDGTDLESSFAEHFDRKTVLDVDVLDGEQAAILHGDQRLTWGPPPETEGAWSHEVNLGEFKSTFPSWASSLRLGPRPGRVERDDAKAVGFPQGTLLANAHGIGIASNFSGNVALFRPGSTEEALSMSLGTAPEDRIYARPTAKGLLVTVVFNGRSSTVFRVNEKGRLLAHVAEAPTGRPPALRMKHHTVDFVDTLAIARNAKLESVNELSVAMRPVTAASSLDGRHFAVADPFGGDMALFSVTAKGVLREVDRVSYADLRRQGKAAGDRDKPDKAYYLERVPGEPCIGFAAKPVVSPPWTISTGEFALPFVVRSSGGAGRGLAIRLSGDALKDVTLTSASLGGESVEFRADGDGQLAELPNVTLVEGVMLPFQPKPTEAQKAVAEAILRESHLRLVVHGSAERASRAILRVEVGALGASSTPLKWMRPLVVSAG